MAEEAAVTRKQLIDLLNEDLAREYQAIIAYVVYSQVLKGAEYMNIAAELEVHAGEELQHAITIARHIDYLGGMPTATALPVVLSEKAKVMLRADLENENDTVKNYRERLKQCEALQEYAIAEDIREWRQHASAGRSGSRARACLQACTPLGQGRIRLAAVASRRPGRPE